MSDPDWNELRKQVSHGMSVPSGLAGRMMDRIEELEARSDGLTAAVREIHDLEAEVERLRAALQQVMARLADLLESDQFNNIEALVLNAGVDYPELAEAQECPDD